MSDDVSSDGAPSSSSGPSATDLFDAGNMTSPWAPLATLRPSSSSVPGSRFTTMTPNLHRSVISPSVSKTTSGSAEAPVGVRCAAAVEDDDAAPAPSAAWWPVPWVGEMASALGGAVTIGGATACAGGHLGSPRLLDSSRCSKVALPPPSIVSPMVSATAAVGTATASGLADALPTAVVTSGCPLRFCCRGGAIVGGSMRFRAL
mmetsp:Transcript_77303/g.214892  ORF Transcript_77303/g.214892 Transcript_77303/m.214892 type:complete len:204 (-) Transcript_77303:1061-1672(-)